MSFVESIDKQPVPLRCCTRLLEQPMDVRTESWRVNRRWQPAMDPAEWERRTRESIFRSVRLCVAHALYASLSTEIHPDELHASDTVFRELHGCSHEYACALYALGQEPDEASRLIVAAATEAAAPTQLHPAIVSALEEWCREAYAEAR
jgi:hypothetical protein